MALMFSKCLGTETGTNHFLVAARVEFGTGNRHVPFFGTCPCGVPRGVPPQTARTARTAQRLQRQLQTAPRESANTEHSTSLFRGGNEPCTPPSRSYTPANASSSEPPLHSASKRLFLDVFAGRLHPVTSAPTSLGLDCFEPFDLDGNTTHDILDNEVFEALLRLCWSGIVVLIMLARRNT